MEMIQKQFKNGYCQCYSCDNENPEEEMCDETNTGALIECDEDFNGTWYHGCKIQTGHDTGMEG